MFLREEVAAAMDFKYYTSVLVAEPGAEAPRQYNGVISMADAPPACDVEELVGAAICRSLGVPREKVRVLHCARIH
jgi:hypothetical protein